MSAAGRPQFDRHSPSPSHAGRGEPPSRGGGGAPEALARIILVGRTGLDAALRSDPRIELVRARTALAAVGELATPMDVHSPRRAAVIVAEGGEPAHDAPRLVAALRAVDPEVRVLRAVSPGPRTPTSPAYDGQVNEDARADEVLALALAPAAPVASPSQSASAPSPAAPAAPVIAPAARPGPVDSGTALGFTPGRSVPLPELPAPTMPAPLVAPVVAPAASADGTLGDAALADVLSAGGDVGGAALAVIRARTGRPDVIFHRASEGATPIAPGALGVAPVRHAETTFGHLVCPALSAAALEQHARWLGSWLALEAQHERLRQAALTDELTGAWNRRYFDRFMEAALPAAQLSRQPLTLLVFDIDNFKQYNDQFGHAAGDDILRHTVALLRATTRQQDKVCRIGGDEFAVIFYAPGGPREPGSQPPAEVCSIARRFQEQVRAARFPKLGKDAPGRLSVSGGLATFPWDGRTPAELLARADAIALQSKRAGKGVIVLGPGADEPRPGEPPVGAP